jgi:phosphoribosyl 1,2-cyclic phosphodiesterase
MGGDGSLRVTVLGSGSGGNATLVESGGVRLLIDAGFSGRDLARRLAAVEVEPESLTALLVTHDHGDHTRGMGVMARRHGIPLYLTSATRTACAPLLSGTERVIVYRAEEPVSIGGLDVHPFLTVHDAVDPIAVTVTERSSGDKLGIATDLGRPTASCRRALAGCHLLVLEANHDEVRLHAASYPWRVKARIAGSHGHLSNRAAGELAVELAHPGLGAVILAHLSREANDPGLAADTVGRSLRRTRFRGRLSVARQDSAGEPVEVGDLRRRIASPQLSLL